MLRRDGRVELNRDELSWDGSTRRLAMSVPWIVSPYGSVISLGTVQGFGICQCMAITASACPEADGAVSRLGMVR
jgi:hypothetical protein